MIKRGLREEKYGLLFGMDAEQIYTAGADPFCPRRATHIRNLPVKASKRAALKTHLVPKFISQTQVIVGILRR